MNNIKQVIIIRKDLHMRMGKVAVQVAHASMKVILDWMENKDLIMGNGKVVGFEKKLIFLKGSPLEQWLNGVFKKVCVYVNSEDELIKIYGSAIEKGIMCSLIEDVGLTEFHGIKTKTCVAIGPDYSDRIDEITGNLPLL